MPRYAFLARDSQGRALRGLLTGGAPKDLNALGLKVESVNATAGWLAPWQDLERQIRGADSYEVAQFLRQFASMVSAGIPLARSAILLARSHWSPALSGAIQVMEEALLAGQSLSAVMELFPDFFSRPVISLVRVGETVGKLAESLQRAADLAESDSRRRRQLGSALVYPGFILLMFLLLGFVTIVFIFPRFADVLDSMQVARPWPLELALQGARFVGQPAVLLGLAELLVVAGILLWSWLRLPSGQEWRDRLLMRIPLLRTLLIKVALGRLAYSLAVLTEAGVPLTEGLKASQDLVGNRALRASLGRVTDQLRKGDSLGSALARERLYPPAFVQMVSMAEESGAYDMALRHLQRFYEQEVDLAMATMLSLIEPIIILIMGTAVGAFLLSMMLPLMALFQNLGQ